MTQSTGQIIKRLLSYRRLWPHCACALVLQRKLRIKRDGEEDNKGNARQRKREKAEEGRPRVQDTEEEGGCSLADDQMIRDKLAQCTDLWGHPGR